MKIKIIFEIDNEDDSNFIKIALLNAEKNKLRIDTLYDDIFRPSIKYGNEIEAQKYSEVWEHVSAHFND